MRWAREQGGRLSRRIVGNTPRRVWYFVRRPTPQPETHPAPTPPQKAHVVLVCRPVAQDRVHPPRLVVGRDHLEVGEHAPQVVLLHLGAYVLRDQVDRDEVVSALPGDDHVGVAAAGGHVLVERRLDKLPQPGREGEGFTAGRRGGSAHAAVPHPGAANLPPAGPARAPGRRPLQAWQTKGTTAHPRVLLDDARHVAPPLLHVALDAARQPHVVVGVDVDLWVTGGGR